MSSDAADLVARLVAVDSINPDLIAGAAGEAGVARVVAEWAERAGLDVEVEEIAPGRPNVVVTARGSGGGGKTLLLNAHTDTVGIAGMERPHEPRVEDGRLYGRGAYDMKGGLAAALLAAVDAAGRGLRGDVVVTAVVDEEVASIGTEAVVRAVGADAAVVTEPTDERVCVAHKGFVAFELETRGRAAHGSRPDIGIDAIARMGPVLVRLAALDEELRAAPSHPLLGSGSLHASLVEGGQEYSSYPEHCLLRGERRTVPGETVAQVEDELRRILADADGEARVTFSREPLETDAGEPIVEALLRHTGADRVDGVAFWADSALLGAAGIPTVVYGPRGAGAHEVEEWVELESVERVARVLAEAAAEICA